MKLDHLGKVVKTGGRQRYRYARTYTVVYDGNGTEETAAAEKTYRLLLDTARAINLRTAGLTNLFHIMQNAAPSSEHSLIGPRAFKLGMAQYGLKDPILTQRLFNEFKEPPDPEQPSRIDFRQFLRTLATMSKEPVEDRLSLLFEVWDADESGTLSYPELATHVVHDLAVHKRESALHSFNNVWTQVKNFSKERDAESESFDASSGAATEVSRDNLVDACTRLPAVRHFFDAMLTRRPPKADELARRFGNFQARLRELDGQVFEEVRAGARGEDPSDRPATVGGGRGRQDPEKARAQALKEKTDAILKTVSSSHSSSLGITHSSSAKAIAMARQQANEYSLANVRPKTAVEGGVGKAGPGGGRNRRNLHGFVKSKSTSGLEPLPKRSGTAVTLP